jgi:hypothetical protein
VYVRLFSPRTLTLLGALVFVLLAPLVAVAHAPANQHFERTWARTDHPVLNGDVSRTWIWGPEGFTQDCTEPYHKLAIGEREVQYFDKSRMEINEPSADSDSPWYVTQGLLAKEMIVGEMQLGDHTHIDWHPAGVHVAGDPGGGSPSYADFAPLMGLDPLPAAATITQTLDSSGGVGSDPSLSGYGVTAAEFVDLTGHRVASVFWDFMTSDGLVLEEGALANEPLFENPFYAVGLPITEAYWTRVEVDGVEQDVLVQAFERRVLTYTPANADGWKVEAGNVGQHYYIWRYGEMPDQTGDGCPDTLQVTFNVYEPRGGGDWEQIAITETSEVWHPGGVATGTWRAFSGSTVDLDNVNSTGVLVAHHNYQYVFGGNFLVGLEADIEQITGPTLGTASISASDFAVGSDPRVSGSVFTGSGSMTYDTAQGAGTIEFDVAGTLSRKYHVFLDGPAPPIFFPSP